MSDTQPKAQVDLVSLPSEAWLTELAEMHRKSYLVDGIEELMPMFFAQKADGELIIIVAPFNGPDEKYAVLAQLRTMFREMGVTRYAASIEAWAAAQTMDPEADVHDMSTATRPSQDPNRREIVMNTVCEKGKPALSLMQEIIRDESGAIIDLVKDPHQMDGGMMMGSFVELLDQPTMN